LVSGVLIGLAGAADAVIMQGIAQNYVAFEAEAGVITNNTGNKQWVLAAHGNAGSVWSRVLSKVQRCACGSEMS
jgi:hypothetical protein